MASFYGAVNSRGFTAASGVQLSVTLPNKLFVQSATNSAGTCQITASNVTCSVASLSSMDTLTVELILRAKFLPELASEFEALSDLSCFIRAAEIGLNPADSSLALPITIWPQLDWGDARSGFPVSLAEHGARHRYWPGYLLGTLWDRQPDGFHSALADWDDSHNQDDDDGVVFLKPLVAGGNTLTFIVPSTAVSGTITIRWRAGFGEV